MFFVQTTASLMVLRRLFFECAQIFWESTGIEPCYITFLFSGGSVAADENHGISSPIFFLNERLKKRYLLKLLSDHTMFKKFVQKKLSKTTSITILDFLWQNGATVLKPYIAEWNRTYQRWKVFTLYSNSYPVQKEGKVSVCARTEKWKTYTLLKVLVRTSARTLFDVF